MKTMPDILDRGRAGVDGAMKAKGRFQIVI
jgi:hypothetical protein